MEPSIIIEIYLSEWVCCLQFRREKTESIRKFDKIIFYYINISGTNR